MPWWLYIPLCAIILISSWALWGWMGLLIVAVIILMTTKRTE